MVQVVPEAAVKLDSANPSVVPEMRSIEPLNITFTAFFAIGKVRLHISLSQRSRLFQVYSSSTPF
jgi:hypothetical protein